MMQQILHTVEPSWVRACLHFSKVQKKNGQFPVYNAAATEL